MLRSISFAVFVSVCVSVGAYPSLINGTQTRLYFQWGAYSGSDCSGQIGGTQSVGWIDPGGSTPVAIGNDGNYVRFSASDSSICCTGLRGSNIWATGSYTYCGATMPQYCHACVTAVNTSFMHVNGTIFEISGGNAFRTTGPILFAPGVTTVCVTNTYSSGHCPFTLQVSLERPAYDTPTNFVAGSQDGPGGQPGSDTPPNPPDPGPISGDPTGGGTTNLAQDLSKLFGELITEVKKLDKEVTQQGTTNLLGVGNLQRGAMWRDLTNYQGAQLYALNGISNLLKGMSNQVAVTNVSDTNGWAELTNFHRDFVNWVTNEWASNAAAWSRGLALSNELWAAGAVGTNTILTNLSSQTAALESARDKLAQGPEGTIGNIAAPSMVVAWNWKGESFSFDFDPFHNPVVAELLAMIWELCWWFITLCYWIAVIELYWNTWREIIKVGPIKVGTLVVAASPAMWGPIAALIGLAGYGLSKAGEWLVGWMTGNAGLVDVIRHNYLADHAGGSLDVALYLLGHIIPIDYALGCLLSYLTLWLTAILAHMIATAVLKGALVRA